MLERQCEESRAALRKAIELAGSQQALADDLGVTQQAISKWLQRGWVSVDRAREIETLYGVPRITLVNPVLLDMLDVH